MSFFDDVEPAPELDPVIELPPSFNIDPMIQDEDESRSMPPLNPMVVYTPAEPRAPKRPLHEPTDEEWREWKDWQPIEINPLPPLPSAADQVDPDPDPPLTIITFTDQEKEKEEENKEEEDVGEGGEEGEKRVRVAPPPRKKQKKEGRAEAIERILNAISRVADEIRMPPLSSINPASIEPRQVYLKGSEANAALGKKTNVGTFKNFADTLSSLLLHKKLGLDPDRADIVERLHIALSGYWHRLGYDETPQPINILLHEDMSWHDDLANAVRLRRRKLGPDVLAPLDRWFIRAFPREAKDLFLARALAELSPFDAPTADYTVTSMLMEALDERMGGPLLPTMQRRAFFGRWESSCSGVCDGCDATNARLTDGRFLYCSPQCWLGRTFAPEMYTSFDDTDNDDDNDYEGTSRPIDDRQDDSLIDTV